MGDGGSPEHTQGSTEAVDRRNTSKELWLPSSSGVGTASTFRKEEHKKREGFVCFMVTIHSVKGVRFGLGIKHFNDQVIVSKSEKGSICGSQLKVLDHIVEVNGIPVTDKDVCREMLIKSMQHSNMVNLVIERPVNDEAITNMKSFLEAACRPSAHSSPVNSGAHNPVKPLSPVNLEMGSAKGSRKDKVADNHEKHINLTNAAVRKSQRLVPWPCAEEYAFDNRHENQQIHRLRRLASTKAKHEDADPATDREKRATDAIVVKGKKDSRLIAKLGLKRKSEVHG